MTLSSFRKMDVESIKGVQRNSLPAFAVFQGPTAPNNTLKRHILEWYLFLPFNIYNLLFDLDPEQVEIIKESNFRVRYIMGKKRYSDQKSDEMVVGRCQEVLNVVLKQSSLGKDI